MKNITYYNAGAGSGKTYKLTEKLVEILKDKNVNPENIILTTFTKAAASDFKLKAREKLLSKGMYDMAASLEDAKIGTVHSVGLQYIRKYWYILGRSASFTEMDDEVKSTYVSSTLFDVVKEKDIELFHKFARERGLPNKDFWKGDLVSIIEKCDTFGISDLDKCLKVSLEHIDTMYPSVDTADVKEVVTRIFEIAKEWRDGFNKVKERDNLLSYSDMEYLFLELLDNEIVQNDIRNTIKYVFVDEFQDSNQIQLKIFDKLSDLVEKSFWVGDSKQAIYRFRGCDTELVTAIMKYIQESSKEGNEYSRELDTSWRSTESLVNLSNSVFVPLFKELLDKKDVTLKTNRCDDNISPRIYNWDLTARIPEGGKRKSANRSMLLDATAAKVKDILDGNHKIKHILDKETGKYRNVKPSDIAILLLKDGQSKNITNQIIALRKYGVPVNAPESFSSDRAEICLVKCMLSYMINFNKPLLKAEISRLMYDTALNDLISSSFENDIFKVLEDIRSAQDFTSVTDVVVRIIQGLNLYKRSGEWGESKSRERVLDGIIQLARDYDKREDATLEGFLASFPNEISVDGEPNGVVVMTYHKSKGLEWPIVILDTSSRESESTALKGFCYGAYAYRESKPTSKKLYSDFSLHYCPNLLTSANSRVEDGVKENVNSLFADCWNSAVLDSRRLLYVGITRARDYLITLSQDAKKQDFFDECGISTDLKKAQDNEMFDLWGGVAPQVLFEKISDNRETPNQSEETSFLSIVPSAEECCHKCKYISPSSIEGEKAKAEVVKNFKRMALQTCNTSDYDKFGTCIHNMFAIYDPTVSESLMIEKFRIIVNQHGMKKVLVDIESVITSIKNLYQFLTEKYGVGEVHKEYPFMHLNGENQIVGGSIDLLWKIDKGAVIVDYKNYPGFDDVVNEESSFYAGKYGPQLLAYKEAISSECNVIDTLIYYAVQGRIVKLIE